MDIYHSFELLPIPNLFNETNLWVAMMGNVTAHYFGFGSYRQLLLER